MTVGVVALFLLALAAILCLTAAMQWLAELLDRRALRRAVARAHQPRPFDWQADSSHVQELNGGRGESFEGQAPAAEGA